MQKTNFLRDTIFVVVSLLLVSCANNDLLTESEQSTAAIHFITETDEDFHTRANLMRDDFGVFGYYTGKLLVQDFLGAGNIPEANWMYNQKVEYRNNAYTYSPISYWPADREDKITFIAYAPLADGKNIAISTPNTTDKKGAPIFRYTTDPDNPTTDFLVSRPAFDLTRESGSVKFLMQHVLSKLQFRIKSTTPNVKIRSIGLRDVMTQASFNAFGRVWENYDTSKSTLKTYTIAEEEQSLNGNFRLLTDHYIVLPQETSGETRPVFTLVMEVGSEEETFEFSPATSWEKYNAYIYNITYTGDDLEVETDLEPWTENAVDDDILANQYLNVSTRKMDLAQSHHFYYNSSFPTTQVSDMATYPDLTKFILSEFYKVIYDGTKIRLQNLNKTTKSEIFTIYLHGLDLHGHVAVSLPIEVKTESGGGDIEIDGTFWAPGNIIAHDGHLEIAPSANYTGLYFRWGSLIGLAGNNAGSFAFLQDKTVGFRPVEYTGVITKWDDVPYVRSFETSEFVGDAFAGRYTDGLGFDAANALGDPCRYMSNQKGWTKGKWRMPTKAEFDDIVTKRKVRKINGNWGIADESHVHTTATTGVLPVEAGWFVKADPTDDSIPSDDEFSSIKPPAGWMFFPASGQRSGWSGALSEYSTMGYYWCSSVASWDAPFRFQYSRYTTGDNPGSFDDIASAYVHGSPVRCVRDIQTTEKK